MITKDINDSFATSFWKINFDAEPETFFGDKDGGIVSTFLHDAEGAKIFEFVRDGAFGKTFAVDVILNLARRT